MIKKEQIKFLLEIGTYIVVIALIITWSIGNFEDYSDKAELQEIEKISQQLDRAEVDAALLKFLTGSSNPRLEKRILDKAASLAKAERQLQIKHEHAERAIAELRSSLKQDEK